MTRVGVWLAIIGLGLATLMWLIPPARSRTSVRLLIGGVAAYLVVFGVSALLFEWSGSVMSFWTSVVIGGVVCGIAGAFVVGAAWRHVHVITPAASAEAQMAQAPRALSP